MPSSYSTDLRIELIANGEKTSTWGTITNDNLGVIIEDAIAGLVTFTTVGQKYALTAQNGSADQARCAALAINTSHGGDFEIYVPPVTKLYVFKNTNTQYNATVYCSDTLGDLFPPVGASGVTVPPGKTVLLRTDGINVVEQLNHIVGDFSVGGNTELSSITAINSAVFGTTQAASISVASPTVITVVSTPPSNTAVLFSTTDTLPTGLTAGATYYVSKVSDTTFNISTSPLLTPLVNVTGAGLGTHSVATISQAITAPQGTSTNALATTEFVQNAFPVTLTNWAVSETYATQTATLAIASPAVVTVPTAPANGTAVAFSTTGALPTGITANNSYYVFNRTSSSYNLATSTGIAQLATITIATPGVVTVAAAPANGDVVIFTTTGALPTGITAGTTYYVINRTATTFRISATSGGTAINTSGSQSGVHTATWRTLINTSGSQSGVHTETTSKLYFKYKSQNRMSLDLGGNAIMLGNVTSYGTP